MTKKSSQRSTRPKKKQDPALKLQRDSLNMLRDELIGLHLLSLDVMTDRGILPPLYSGEFLEEAREVIPLWGYGEKGDAVPSLGMVLMRLSDDIEPEPDLQELRGDLELSNDLPATDVLDILSGGDRHKIGGVEGVEDLKLFMVLGGDQLRPAPGYEKEEMLDFIGQRKPYALFLNIPTTGEGDNLTYQWDNFEGMRADVVYAETSELLEAAVWDYRLRLALEFECREIEAEGGVPGDELVAVNERDLVGLYDLMVMGVTRFYGTTSPLRAQQEKLDVLREENGDLIVKTPLLPALEPVSVLAEERARIEADDDQVMLHIQADSSSMQTIWPHIRPHRYFCIRVRHGIIRLVGGRAQPGGYADAPVFEWLTAETLPELYRLAHLFALREFLLLSRAIDQDRIHVE